MVVMWNKKKILKWIINENYIDWLIQDGANEQGNGTCAIVALNNSNKKIHFLNHAKQFNVNFPVKYGTGDTRGRNVYF